MNNKEPTDTLGYNFSQRSFLMYRIQRRIPNLDTLDFWEKTENISRQDYQYLIKINNTFSFEEFSARLKKIIDYKTLN